jgi:cyclic pyranopterin phosphate synthase
MSHPLPQLDMPPGPPPAPDARHTEGVLHDSHGRTIHDLRLSITDRCNFRCVYCMEPGDRFLPKRSLLSSGEYLAIVDAAIALGVRKIRITGGEPTLYPDLDALIDELGRRGLDDIAMTTNGWHLDPRRAARWKASGLRRLTFSLDTLREDRMATITRSATSVADVLRSVDIAAAEGLTNSKINVVAMRGHNEDEYADFADLARERALDIRFIEFMPLDSGRLWKPDSVVSETEIVDAISQRHTLHLRPSQNPHSTSRHYEFADGGPGRIGVIASVTRPFCGACNRLRVTAEGAVRPCLFSNTEWDIRPLLRSGGTHGDIVRFLIDAVWTKQVGHGIGRDDFQQPDRRMSAIGG